MAQEDATLGRFEGGAEEANGGYGFGGIARLVSRVLGVPVTAVTMVEGERLRIVASIGCPFDWLPRSGSLPGCTLDRGGLEVVEDLAAHDPPLPAPEIEGKPLRFYAGIPIRGPEGDLVGTLWAADFAPRRLDPEGIALFEALAELARDRLRLVRELEQHRHAAAALRASERRLEDFAETASDWFWEMDAELRFSWLSESVRARFGFDPAWHYGKTRLEIAATDADREVARRIQEIMERREPFRDFEYCRRGPTGDHWLRISGKPVFDEAGRFLGYRGTGRDITELKRAEAERREAEERYRTLVELCPLGLFVHIDGIVTYANAAAAEILGARAPEELVGKRALAFIDEADRARIAERLQRLLDRGGATPPLEVRVRRFDGSVTVVESMGALIHDRGRPAIQVAFRDVSERKRLEAALREAEERYRTLFELSPDGIFVKDSDHRILFANRTAAALFGVGEPKTLIGRETLEFYSPEDRSIVEERTRALLEKGGAVPPMDLAIRRADGSVAFVEVAASRFEDKGEPRILVVQRDITERKLAERAREEAERRYRTLVELCPEALLVQQDGRYVFANRRALELLGARDACELAGLTPRELYLPEYVSRIEARVRYMLETGGTVPPLEARIRRRDGSIVEIETSGAAVEFDGRPAIQVVLRDISERKRAERALREAEARYRALVELCPDAVVLVDEGRFVFANAPAARLLGVPNAEALVERSIYDFIVPEQHEIVRARHAVPLEEGKALPAIELAIVRPDGERREIEATGSLVLREGRRLLLGVLRDVTERKRAERALKEAEERYRALVELAPVGILVYRDGCYRLVNRAAAEILGADDPSCLVGVDPFALITEPYRERIRERAARLLAEGGRAPPIVIEMRRLDGATIAVETVSAGIRDGGRPAVQIAMRDVTERERARRALEEAEARWRSLVELSPDAVVLVRDGRYVFANRSALELFGASDPSQLLGHSPFDFILEDHWPAIEERMRVLLEQGGRVPPIEIRIRRLDGTILDIETAGAVVFDGGRPAILGVLRDISQRKALEAELRRQAHHDSLTGLPNRLLFYDRLEQLLARAERERRQGALLLLDLDGFKPINDAYGHDAGDALLCAVARRLKRVIRRSDTAARLGGDEFALLLYPVAEERTVEQIADRILHALTAPVWHEGRALRIGASLGAAFFPRPGEDPRALLKRADLALYRAKARGGGLVFARRGAASGAASVRGDAPSREDFDAARASGAYALVWQPRVELATGRIRLLEVGLRWCDPRSGSREGTTSEAFAPGANAGVATIESVFAAIGKLLAGWRAEGIAIERVAFDVSPEILAPEGGPERLRRALQQAGLGPESLVLEIDASLVERGLAAWRSALRTLDAAGAVLALDRFGEGTLALACLRDAPFRAVNLAPSLVAELTTGDRAGAFVGGLARFLRGLGMEVAALGVETEAQRRVLSEAGCALGQGRLWTPPLTSEEMSVWLRRLSDLSYRVQGDDRGAGASGHGLREEGLIGWCPDL
ncbi:MAG: PAS domain S-box protein [Geminicoccaceae bacterium]|nr:PAS domain S-box protein [Geminicoccaceae bacterium]